MKPTKDKLNHCWSVKVRNTLEAHDKLLDFVDSKMDRGYRLRHTVENGCIIVSQNSMYDVNMALRFLERFQTEKPKRVW